MLIKRRREEEEEQAGVGEDIGGEGEGVVGGRGGQGLGK